MIPSISFDIIAKAGEADGKRYLEGVASTTDLDAQHERMSGNALAEMLKTAVGLPLTTSHTNELKDEIGEIVEATIDGDKFVIKAEVYEDDVDALKAWRSIKRGRKVGFSVGGSITAARDSVQKGCKRIIEAVALDHIMLTKNPANRATFGTAIAKALVAVDAADTEDQLLQDAIARGELVKSDISAQDRDKYATYTENGEGKFPIRPGNTHDAESALHLIGHAPADKQDAILKRACSILGDSHPRCKEFHSTNKSGDTNSMTNEELEKSGAKLSAATQGALKDIHDSGDDAVKSKVRALLGDSAESVLNVADEAKDGDGDDDGDANGSAGDMTGGVIAGKSDEAVDADPLSKEQVSSLLDELKKEIRDVAQSTVKELLKARPDLKGANGVIEKTADTDNEDAFALMLRKCIRF
jgi:phage head maturation protease